MKKAESKIKKIYLTSVRGDINIRQLYCLNDVGFVINFNHVYRDKRMDFRKNLKKK